MPRRRPLCALCGRPTKHASISMRYDCLPGKPEVAWHADVWPQAQGRNDCWGRDRASAALAEARDSVEQILAKIARRGPGRVVRNKERRP